MNPRRFIPRLSTNHWGWSFTGIKTWIKYAWSRPVTWGVEIHDYPLVHEAKNNPYETGKLVQNEKRWRKSIL